MGTLDRADVERLGLYRISPGVAGWLLELLLTPAALFLFLYGLAFAFAGSRPHAFQIAAIPAVLCLLPNVTFFLHILMEQRSSRADILYLRNYIFKNPLAVAIRRSNAVSVNPFSANGLRPL